MNRRFANVAIIIALVVIAAGAGWWYMNKSSTPATSETTQLPPLQEATNTQPQTATKSSVPAMQAQTNPPSVNPAQSNSISGTLAYVRSTNRVDPQKNRLGVSFIYTTKPLCDSRTTRDFSVETGDGRTYLADCGGVVGHVYAAAGEYRARYLLNRSEIASVQVKLISGNETNVTLYHYTGASGAEYQSVIRPVPSGSLMADATLLLLLKTYLPKLAPEYIIVSLITDSAVVNFKQGAHAYLDQAPAGVSAEYTNSIRQTLLQFDTIKKVHFSIDGQIITDWDA